MLKQRHETQLACALTDAFAALVEVIAKGRWGGASLVLGTTLPQPGCRYEQQRGKVLRRGKVLACLRPGVHNGARNVARSTVLRAIAFALAARADGCRRVRAARRALLAERRGGAASSALV